MDLTKQERVRVTQALLLSGMWVIAAKFSNSIKEFIEAISSLKEIPWLPLFEYLRERENPEILKTIKNDGHHIAREMAKDFQEESSPLKKSPDPIPKSRGGAPSGKKHWAKQPWAKPILRAAALKGLKTREKNLREAKK